MASEWVIRPLEDCMAALIDYRGKTPHKTSFGIPLITAKVVKGGRIETPDEFISVDDYEPWMRRGIPKVGDVVITTEAPLGEVAQLGTERVALAQRLIALRGKPGILDNGFLKFLMQSEDIQDQLRARASGTTVLGIKQSELRKVSLTLPPIAEQRAIAHILGTLDDKIDLNRRMNETLEAMARALFKSWFVDFDPVRAKSEGRDPGLPKPIADLFPSHLVNSELGKIPEGWEVCKWGDLATLEYGKSLRAYNNPNGPYIVFGTNGPIGTTTLPLCQHPTVVIGRKGAYRGVHYTDYPCFVIDTAFFLEPIREFEMRWVYYHLLAADINAMDSGSAIPSTSREDFYALPILYAPPETQRRFTELLEPVWSKQSKNHTQSHTLAAMRDALLPKLISGKIRILEFGKRFNHGKP